MKTCVNLDIYNRLFIEVGFCTCHWNKIYWLQEDDGYVFFNVGPFYIELF